MRRISDLLDEVEAGSRATDLESSFVEFKQEANSPKETLQILADAVVCMANADGGVIVLGVSDKEAGAAALVGVKMVDQNTIAKGVFDRTEPALTVQVSTHRRDGREFVEIVVPRGVALYSNTKGTATRRVNDRCVPFTPEQQRQVLVSRGQYDWSAQLTSSTAVDAVAMAHFRSLLHRAGYEDLSARDDGSILSDMRLAGPDGSLTHAGVLVVGSSRSVAELIPQHEYSYQFRPSPGSEATARFRERSTLMGAIDQVLGAIESRADVSPLNISGGVQLRREDYPADAVRELVVNAFVHRDFELAGAIDIEHSPDALVIRNPGGLVYGVTPDNILSHPSTPRNQLLLETITTLRIAERTGQGVDRAYRVLLRSGKKPPTYTDSGQSVAVTVAGGSGNSSFTRFVETVLDQDMAADIDVLLALDRLCTVKRLTASELSRAIQRPDIDAERVLSRMVAADLVAVQGRRSAGGEFGYALTSRALTGLGIAVRYHKRVSDDVDEKVVGHVREYGYVTNPTIRRLLDLDLYPARDLLKRLVARRILKKAKGPERGPNVRYIPGPDFPAR